MSGCRGGSRGLRGSCLLEGHTEGSEGLWPHRVMPFPCQGSLRPNAIFPSKHLECMWRDRRS
eukprot:4366411-Prorocentrum_lima.AAC.1